MANTVAAEVMKVTDEQEVTAEAEVEENESAPPPPWTDLYIPETDIPKLVRFIESLGLNESPEDDVPDAVQHLTRAQLLSLPPILGKVREPVGSYPEGWKYVYDRELTSEQYADASRHYAAIRGKASAAGYCCGILPGAICTSTDGSLCVDVANPELRLHVQVSIAGEFLNPGGNNGIISIIERYDAALFRKLAPIPELYKDISSYTLLPYQARKDVQPALSLKAQADYIKQVKGLMGNYDLRGWLLMGPTATSKTTYVCAYIKDLVTWRLVNRHWEDWELSDPRFHPCVWRLKMKTWIDQNHAFMTRDFDGPSVEQPLDAGIIDKTCDLWDHSPVIWLEELDKVVWNPKRKNEFHTLIDAVYERKGLIIVTTNATREILKKMLPEETRRRITGLADNPDDFIRWDFHADIARGR